MKLLNYLFIALIIFGCHPKKTDDLITKTETTKINLPSMVCGTCKNTIQKAIYRIDGVKEVNIDLDKKTAEVTFIPYQTSLEVIEDAVTEAGYDANAKKRNKDAYDKLEKCCKIDG
ncbi:MAG: heavy-metal-associated domain-containing protein [Bacteroidota bacterium]